MKHFDFEAFAEAIKSLKTENGIKLHMLADITGMTKSTISRAITNTVRLDIDNILALCDIMERPITDFIISKNSNNGKKSKDA